MKDQNANRRPARKSSRRKPGRRRQTQEGRKVRFFRLIARIISRRQRGTD